jgi:hypothetical protein
MTRAGFGFVLSLALLATLVASAFGLQQRAIQMKEDYGSEPLSTCYLNYYYYIPCTTSSWFWMLTGWHTGDKVGAWFRVGDPSMGTVSQCDATNCQQLDKFRVLDFAGYGTYRGGLYEGLFTVEFDVYCADAEGCPVGPSLWNSGPVETGPAGWFYVPVSPPLSICRCDAVSSQPASAPRILVVATHTGTLATYPAWGLDNVNTPVSLGCAMHDTGCLPALYPRPYVSNYSTMHSGYYGNGSFQYCPPQWFKDGGDTTPSGTQRGYVELAWRIYLNCTGPSATVPTTWGTIKSMYK